MITETAERLPQMNITAISVSTGEAVTIAPMVVGTGGDDSQLAFSDGNSGYPLSLVPGTHDWLLHDDIDADEDDAETYAETITDIYDETERGWEKLANEELAWYGFRLGVREMSDDGGISYRLEAA